MKQAYPIRVLVYLGAFAFLLIALKAPTEMWAYVSLVTAACFAGMVE